MSTPSFDRFATGPARVGRLCFDARARVQQRETVSPHTSSSCRIVKIAPACMSLHDRGAASRICTMTRQIVSPAPRPAPDTRGLSRPLRAAQSHQRGGRTHRRQHPQGPVCARRALADRAGPDDRHGRQPHGRARSGGRLAGRRPGDHPPRIGCLRCRRFPPDSLPHRSRGPELHRRCAGSHGAAAGDRGRGCGTGGGAHHTGAPHPDQARAALDRDRAGAPAAARSTRTSPSIARSRRRRSTPRLPSCSSFSATTSSRGRASACR